MPQIELPPAICLMGPTAAGKTALALALHAVLPVDIISVDSSQVYRGMDIGTAKPTMEERARVPHRLIDIRDPAQAYSAAEFCADALREMAEVTHAGRVPLLVGGTMFYFQALEFGLSDLPSADPEIRARLSTEAAQVGWAAMHRRLQAVDSVSAARIHPNDAQRIQRALEIFELTDRAPSFINATAARTAAPYRFVKLALWPENREDLHARIARRFHAMLEQGLIAEVEALRRRGDLSADMPSMRMVGYRQVWEYLINSSNYYEMAERAIAATRQFAKRQMTWLRSFRDLQSFDGDSSATEKACLAYLSEKVRFD